MSTLMGVCAALVLGGLVAVVRGLSGPDRPRERREQGRFGRRVAEVWQRQRRLVVLGGVAGVFAFWLTSWPVLLLAVPVMVVALPWLLAAPPNHDVAILEALDRWVRTLAATLTTGRSIADAIRVSRRQAPTLLVPHLDRLVRRIDQRWTVPDALHAMADELSSPDADAVLAALMLAAERGGTGASATLKALADSIQARLRALREIEAERAKPRVVVRQVTGISLAMLGLALIAARDFFEPYSTPLGQVILAGLLAVYLGSLVVLRSMTAPPPRERILRSLA